MAAREPWLSIVMPVWNGERYLPDALESVRREGTDGYEVIAVDDGSSDNTAGEAESAGAKVIRHSANLGKGAALKTGLGYAVSI